MVGHCISVTSDYRNLTATVLNQPEIRQFASHLAGEYDSQLLVLSTLMCYNLA